MMAVFTGITGGTLRPSGFNELTRWVDLVPTINAQSGRRSTVALGQVARCHHHEVAAIERGHLSNIEAFGQGDDAACPDR
jgi:hypothetical protein